MTLTMCVNTVAAPRSPTRPGRSPVAAAAGEIDPEKISEATFAKYLDEPDMPDVDCSCDRPASSGRRTSDLAGAYAELVFQEKLFRTSTAATSGLRASSMRPAIVASGE